MKTIMNFPTEFIDRMKNMLGEEYPAFENAFTKPSSHSALRITKKEATELVLNTLGDCKKIPWCDNGYYSDKSIINGKHPYHMAGLVYFQEASATAPVSALPINKGDYVLDLCAAPGGKSTQAAEKLSGTGLLVANEIIPKRAEILSENIERCGIKNAIVTCETPQRLSEKFPEFFDKIIVDAPCSGEGMFRKEPQAIQEWSVAHTKSCALRQQHIIDCAIKMLRPGGFVIYSTCTFAPVENEENVRYILSKYHDMSLVPINLPCLSDGINMPEAKRVFPHISDGEGHFMALLKKEGTSPTRQTFKKNNPPELFSCFEKDTFSIKHEGFFHLFGEHLYLLPEDINLDKIKVIRPGLYLGIVKKGRFEPSHALALASSADSFLNTLSLKLDSNSLLKFLRGEIIPCNCTGWTCVLADGFPIGWGKASNGELKNHFPKKYRI